VVFDEHGEIDPGKKFVRPTKTCYLDMEIRKCYLEVNVLFCQKRKIRHRLSVPRLQKLLTLVPLAPRFSRNPPMLSEKTIRIVSRKIHATGLAANAGKRYTNSVYERMFAATPSEVFFNQELTKHTGCASKKALAGADLCLLHVTSTTPPCVDWPAVELDRLQKHVSWVSRPKHYPMRWQQSASPRSGDVMR